jgi:hypothetical protein
MVEDYPTQELEALALPNTELEGTSPKSRHAHSIQGCILNHRALADKLKEDDGAEHQNRRYAVSRQARRL